MENSTVLTKGQIISEYKKYREGTINSRRATNSEAILFLKELYKNPPKIKIIWDEVDKKEKVRGVLTDTYDYRRNLKSGNRISSSNFYKEFNAFNEKLIP